MKNEYRKRMVSLSNGFYQSDSYQPRWVELGLHQVRTNKLGWSEPSKNSPQNSWLLYLDDQT